MSDRKKDISKRYSKDVLAEHHPRSIGLFTIPEYPEFEAERGMWSAALDVILTTLRYLAPATLLTLFWGQQSFIFKLLKHIDSAFRAIVFSNEDQKKEVLRWLGDVGPVEVEHLDAVWRHGWILCGVLDAALPGTCAGHPPTRLSLKHAQTIADHYLGVEPVFSRQELETNDSLSKHQEWKLANYLDRVRQALAKLTPPASKQSSQRTSPETTQFTLNYVAKGSGLTAAQVNNKMYFKIYPTAQQSLDPGEITVLIRGPRDTYGMTVIPPILGKAQMIRHKLLGLQLKPNFTENVLPITQGATYLRSYGRNDMNKTYFIPKTKYDIEIEVQSQVDHARIGYLVNIEGKYEISITSRGLNIVGSPFSMTASKNIISVLEKDSFFLEDGEEIDIVDVGSDRKVVLRIVDFITEKMLLRENGTLEKITDEEARLLMSSNNLDNEVSYYDAQTCNVTSTSSEDNVKRNFSKIAHEVLTMNRICKIFYDLIAAKQMKTMQKKEDYIRPTNKRGIPDIVNSTFTENTSNPFIVSNKRDRYIIPESISVSLRTEKPKSFYEEEVKNACIEVANTLQNNESSSLETFQQYSISKSNDNDEDNISVDRVMSSNNPFLSDIYEENLIPEKDFGVLVNTEYETNNSQSEETQDTPLKVFVEEDNATSSSVNNNPFIDADAIERPKTPVLKIITGDLENRDGSVYIDPEREFIGENVFGKEFINPFFTNQTSDQDYELPHTVTDFIIGAPVSLPPSAIIRAPSPQPDMNSILITSNSEIPYNIEVEGHIQKQEKDTEVSLSVFETSIHTDLKTTKDNFESENSSSLPSSFHSSDTNATENIDDLIVHKKDKKSVSSQNEVLPSERNTPKKDIWDSAYVSIDDNNSTPDSNNNDNILICDSPNKQKSSPVDNNYIFKRDEFSRMGPAEREIWQTCSELKDDISKIHEDIKSSKRELKRSIIPPIIEENDKSIILTNRDLVKSEVSLKDQKTDPVTDAFAELNNMYLEYFSNVESSPTAVEDDNKLQNKEFEYTIERNDIHVDSASEKISDVKRRAKELEGTISEVQVNVTESVSVSRTLCDEKSEEIKDIIQNKNETQFGDSSHTNIVLEKKKYWDERIREIEAKSVEENKSWQKKRRLSAKHLRYNDSLTKRRGKQLVKNFINAEEKHQTTIVKPIIDDDSIEIINRASVEKEHPYSDVKIVNKWRKYWDDKMETDKVFEITCCKAKSPKRKPTCPQEPMGSTEDIFEITKDSQENKVRPHLLPVKHELPEEVFKAFETSPKRFFGTSRKQILNKIDAFLGKPSTASSSSTDVSGACPDSGLVSSRISLFHNISQTEEFPIKQKRCRSMHNIYQEKDSEKSIDSTRADTTNGKAVEIIQTKILTERDSNQTEKLMENNDTLERTTVNNELKMESENIPIEGKNVRLFQSAGNKSLDETIYQEPTKEQDIKEKRITYVKRAVKDFNKQSQHSQIYKKNSLRKTTVSKSEMDIFSKVAEKITEDDFDRYKSCEELPKINVKNFISLYENVSKTAAKSTLVRKMSRTSSLDSHKYSQSISSSSGAVNKFDNSHHAESEQQNSNDSNVNQPPQPPPRRKRENKSLDRESNYTSLDTDISVDSVDIEIISNKNTGKETTYLSLSDIELEIIENSQEKSTEPTPEREVVTAHIEYKSRFKKAKQFFQSLEELRDVKKTPKLNECEILLYKKSMNQESNSRESPVSDRQPKRIKKNFKSHTMPSSEISKFWNQMQQEENSRSNEVKLVKISEKFNVDDLFNDVVEGKLSRQGSLRGIPHKKAVLETFRSMENVTDKRMSPYEIAISQLKDFAEENKIKNAQTYLSEYPYLPTTDPSKYHSRLDAKASGLISMKELLLNKKPRRNSVPDLRLNTKFTVDL